MSESWLKTYTRPRSEDKCRRMDFGRTVDWAREQVRLLYCGVWLDASIREWYRQLLESKLVDFGGYVSLSRGTISDEKLMTETVCFGCEERGLTDSGNPFYAPLENG